MNMLMRGSDRPAGLGNGGHGAGPAVALALARHLTDIANADRSLGDAVWRLFLGARPYVRALELRPLPGSEDDPWIDGVYRATAEGLYVDPLTQGTPSGEPLDPSLPVIAHDMPLGRLGFTAKSRNPQSAWRILSLAAPTLALAIVDIAHGARKREQDRRHAITTHLLASWLEARTVEEAVRSLAAALLAGWPVETVRFFPTIPGTERIGTSASITVSRLRAPKSPPGTFLVDLDASFRSLPASGPDRSGVSWVDPSVGLFPIRLGGGVFSGVLVLDASLTGVPLGPALDGPQWQEIQRILPVVLRRLPPQGGGSGSPPLPLSWAAQGLPDRSRTLPPELTRWAAMRGTLAVWQVRVEPGVPAPRGSSAAWNEQIRQALGPGHAVTEISPWLLAAFLTQADPSDARATIDRVVLVLSKRIGLDAIALSLPCPTPEITARIEDLFSLARRAGAIGAVTDRDTLHPSAGGGVELFGDDTVTLLARKGAVRDMGRTIRLRPTGARILWALATGSGVASAEEIVSYVWPGDPTASAANLYPHMSALRRDLRAGGATFHIRNRPGEGYTLVPGDSLPAAPG